MLIHRIQVQMQIPSAHSLKEKRGELNRIKDHCRKNFNVSIAESDFQDLHQTAEITLVKLSFTADEGERLVSKFEEFIETHCSVVISAIDIEIL